MCPVGMFGSLCAVLWEDFKEWLGSIITIRRMVTFFGYILLVLSVGFLVLIFNL